MLALSVGSHAALEERWTEVRAARERGEPTVPTTIAAELDTNPLLRAPDIDAFARLCTAKDNFRP